MSDEKTEEPTEHKLQQAREEGQMARSQDIPAAASMLLAMAALYATGDGILGRLRAVVAMALDPDAASGGLEVVWKRMSLMAFEASLALLPLITASALGAVIGTVAHIGLQISPKAVQPKFDNLNPAQGIKRVFSLKSLMTFGQTVVKAVVIGIVVWQAVLGLLPLIAGTAHQSPDSIGQVSWQAVVRLLAFGLVVFVVLGPVDYMIQHHSFMKGQKMSKDEVKREHKGQEGDQEIKGKRKELARELAEEAPRSAVQRADAVIVNPTHYAVAIRYRAEEVGVPVVLAKGVDASALRLRGYAEELGVPVFANVSLARALHKVPVNHAVPEELFEAVSVVLRWVDQIGASRVDTEAAGSGGTGNGAWQ